MIDRGYMDALAESNFDKAEAKRAATKIAHSGEGSTNLTSDSPLYKETTERLRDLCEFMEGEIKEALASNIDERERKKLVQAERHWRILRTKRSPMMVAKVKYERSYALDSAIKAADHAGISAKHWKA